MNKKTIGFLSLAAIIGAGVAWFAKGFAPAAPQGTTYVNPYAPGTSFSPAGGRADYWGVLAAPQVVLATPPISTPAAAPVSSGVNIQTGSTVPIIRQERQTTVEVSTAPTQAANLLISALPFEQQAAARAAVKSNIESIPMYTSTSQEQAANLLLSALPPEQQIAMRAGIQTPVTSNEPIATIKLPTDKTPEQIRAELLAKLRGG